MTILDLPPLGNCEQDGPFPTAVVGLDQSVPQASTAGDGLLQFQLRRLIGEILSDPDLEPDMYVSLVERLTENPGSPQRALLAHLRDVQDPDDLPPFKASRKPWHLPSDG